MNNYASTIAAISTPPGKGGVAIIRISGQDALSVASAVFKPLSAKPFEQAAPRVQIRGNVVNGEEIIDDGMATYFKAPASYTGEDTVEISCHGGILVTGAVLEAVLSAGAVQAEAGEFTKRAYINGKLSLVEAEAVGNLLDAESAAQIRLSSVKARTKLTAKIAEIRAALTEFLSSVYARIDYPDEDLGDLSDSELVQTLSGVREKISALLATYETGHAVAEGVETVICGKTNVGKSSLYNALVKREAAIVTDIAGTTRDIISERLPLGRVMLKLSDTAGLRESTDDPIEAIGIERSRARIRKCELIIAVFDNSRPLDEADIALLGELQASAAAKIAVVNKCDLNGRLDRSVLKSFDGIIEASAKEDGAAVSAALAKAVDALFTDQKISVGNDAIISTARQSAALKRALRLTDTAIAAYRDGIPSDAASSDAELALGAIAELDGRAVSEEIVADIFSRFCVGK